jgi:hypothetical protein
MRMRVFVRVIQVISYRWIWDGQTSCVRGCDESELHVYGLPHGMFRIVGLCCTLGNAVRGIE